MIRAAAEAGDPLAMQIVQNTLMHITQHQQLQNTQDPFWFAVSGEQPPPPPMMMPPPPQGPGGPPPMPDPNAPPPMGPGPVVPEPPMPPPIPPEAA